MSATVERLAWLSAVLLATGSGCGPASEPRAGALDAGSNRVTAAKPRSSLSPSTPPPLADGESVLFDPAKAQKITSKCQKLSLPEPSGVWRPSADEVRAAEAALEVAAGSQVTRDGQRLEIALSQYLRQHVGLTLSGQRVVFTSGTHMRAVMDFEASPTRASNAARADWTQDTVDLCDGGTIGFNALFHVGNRQLVEFRFYPPSLTCCASHACAPALQCVCLERDFPTPQRPKDEHPDLVCVDQRSTPVPLRK